MAGHKREKRPGVWELIVYLGKDPGTGRKRWRSSTFYGGSRAADKELARLVTDGEKEKPSTEQTVGWAVEKWLELQEQRKRSPATLRTYRGYYEGWIKEGIGVLPLGKLTAGDIEDLHAKMVSEGKALSTVRQVHAILRGTIGYAKRKQWVGENVVSEIPAPTLQPSTVVAATPIEANAIYRAAGQPGDDLPTAIALATHTGARLGELCALRWSNVHGGVIHFYSTKTHQIGDVPITATLAERLKERWRFQQERADRVGVELDEDPYILSFWANGSNKPASSSYTHAFARVRDELGLPHLHFHTLRHAFVTQALAAGIDPLTVSKLVRHRDLTMIGRVYGHGTPEATKRAALMIDRAFKTPKSPGTTPRKRLNRGT